MMARLKWYLDPPTPHQLKKNVVKVGPPLTKFSGSAHVDCPDAQDNTCLCCLQTKQKGFLTTRVNNYYEINNRF